MPKHTETVTDQSSLGHAADAAVAAASLDAGVPMMAATISCTPQLDDKFAVVSYLLEVDIVPAPERPTIMAEPKLTNG